MSVQHTSLVWAHSKAEHAARLVLLALADHMNASTGLAWPSVERLCRVTRLSERAVRGALTQLCALGELVEAAEPVSGQRAWALALECPTDCDGQSQHRVRQARQEQAEVAARVALKAGTVRAAERSVAVVPEALADPARVVAEHADAGAFGGWLTGISGSLLEEAHADSAECPADSAGRNMQNLPPHAREPYGGTKRGTTNQPAAATAEGSWTATQGAPVGGGGEVSMIAGDLVRALPRSLAVSVARPVLAGEVSKALERGMDRAGLLEAVQARSWDGARAGAVVAFVRGLVPMPVEVPAAASVARRWCVVHPDCETTRVECSRCRTERVEAARAASTRRREGESIAEWTQRVQGPG